MSQLVETNKPLTAQEREYLHSRGQHQVVDKVDAEYGVDDAEDSDELPESYNDWKTPELKAELKARKLPVSGTDAELIARLEESDAAAL